MGSIISVGRMPTIAQCNAYWGRTRRERFTSANEMIMVTLVGAFVFSITGMLAGVGNAALTLAGFYFFVVRTIFGPEASAFQRNRELLAGRSLVDPWMSNRPHEADDGGIYGALFLGILADVSVVETATSADEYDLADFQDYSMETDEQQWVKRVPYLLRARIQDKGGRSLQVHAAMSEEYLDLRPGQTVAGVLLSTSPSFVQLAALTDFVVPYAECWIGDYPYLDRVRFEAFLSQENPDLWARLEAERGLASRKMRKVYQVEPGYEDLVEYPAKFHYARQSQFPD